MSQASARPVLILGARSDIARALAAEFARFGHPIQLAARDPRVLERDRADLSIRHQVEVTTNRYDALDIDRIEEFLDSLPETPRIVVSVVGLVGDQDENARNPTRASEVIDTNFTGPALTLEAAARRLVELDEDTAVIGISSVAGDRGRARNYIYGAAKAGFSEYLSGMRQKYARTRVHVMTAKPGYVATTKTEDMDLPAILTSTPEELARAVVASLHRHRMVHYDLKWWLIMAVIKLIPEKIFSQLKF